MDRAAVHVAADGLDTDVILVRATGELSQRELVTLGRALPRHAALPRRRIVAALVAAVIGLVVLTAALAAVRDEVNLATALTCYLT